MPDFGHILSSLAYTALVALLSPNSCWSFIVALKASGSPYSTNIVSRNFLSYCFERKVITEMSRITLVFGSLFSAKSVMG